MNTPNYFIFDGILCNEYFDIFTEMDLRPISLFEGLKYEAISEYGPFIFRINNFEEFWDWFNEFGGLQSLGILIYSDSAFEELFLHLQSQLMIELEYNEAPFFFRFFDPRVVQLIFRILEKDQLKEFFKEIEYILAENLENNSIELFTLIEDSLEISNYEKISIEKNVTIINDGEEGNNFEFEEVQ